MSLAASLAAISSRWYALRPYAEQQRLWTSLARFRVVAAGRRSGKTELAKRFLVLKALAFDQPGGRFVCGAPTRAQAKEIYWEDLKLLIPSDFRARRPSETELSIKLWNGATVAVVGMDRPERVEGPILDGYVGDEYGEMREEAWPRHVRPALSTPGRPGWAWLIGVPRGRNHYHDLFQSARADDTGTWDAFHWPSSEIIDPEDLEQARRDLDPLTFDQEYNANFINFEGRAYYEFDLERNAGPVRYVEALPLSLCFDFNRAPGVAAVVQDQARHHYAAGALPDKVDGEFTAVIGEVFIPENSSTRVVCEKLVADWGSHAGSVFLYGDASGGARTSSQTSGSDWDQIEHILGGFFGPARVDKCVPPANPFERVRVNSVNSRLFSAAGVSRLVVNEALAPHVVRDLEGVQCIPGGSGQIQKPTAGRKSNLTHISDALGYYVQTEHPAAGPAYAVQAL